MFYEREHLPFNAIENTMRLFILLLISCNCFANTLTIDIYNKEKVIIKYHLQSNTKSLEFSPEGKQQRLSSWERNDSCIFFDGISSYIKPECSDLKTLQFLLNSEHYGEIDRVYPLAIFSSMGDSLVLNLTKFIPENNTPAIDIRINNHSKYPIFLKNKIYNGSIKLNSSVISKKSEYLYSGNLNKIDSNFAFSIDKTLPNWIKEILLDSPDKFYKYYSNNLDIKFDKKILIVASFFPDSDKNEWRGDVDSSGAISLRFYGKSWLAYDGLAQKTIRKFIAHEVFHIFNSVIYSSLDSVSNSWLHEGSAEAFAVLALRDLGYSSDMDIDKFYENSVNDCNEYHVLREMQIDEKFINSKKIYSCGVLASILLSDNLHKNFVSEYGMWAHIRLSDMFKLWKTVFAKSDSSVYNTSDYYGTLYAYTKNPTLYLDLVIDGERQGDALTRFLTANGIPYHRSLENQSAIIGNLVTAILHQNCSNGYGFWLNDHSLKIQYFDGCKNFDTDFVVITINEFDLFGELSSILNSLGNEVVFSTGNGCSINLTNAINSVVFNKLKRIEIYQ